MRKKGAVAEFSLQRDRELLRSFSEVLCLLGEVPLERLFERASLRPASRFWVSETRAEVVVRKMLKGDSLAEMNPKKREMFGEICLRVKRLMDLDPELTLEDAVSAAVNSEAPEFYLTAKSARTMIYRARMNVRRA